MTFSLTLTIIHPGLAEPIAHVDMLHARSQSALLKTLKMNEKQKCDLKHTGVTRWKDKHGATHRLELKHEAN